jgi:CheY-like chemotaxis protein
MAKLKTLIVEDDRSTQVLYRQGLDEEIFEKRFADTGNEALAIYHKWKPDIILLDIGLPDINGISVLKQIRETPDTATTVVIATSLSDQENVINCMKIGIQGFVVKPFHSKTISESILRYHRKQTSGSGSIDSDIVDEMTKYNWSNIESLERNVTKIRISFGIEIRIEIDGVLPILKTFITGMEHDVYIMIQCPKMTGIESKLYEGNGVKVLYLYSGIVCSFKSKILNFIKKPSRVIFLSYPDSVEQQEIRKNQRIICYLKAALRAKDTHEQYEGMVVDISAGGCKFVIAPPPLDFQSLRLEEDIQLTLELPVSQALLSFSGKLRNLARDSGRITMGLEFAESNDEAMAIIDKYIKSVQDFS